MFQFNAEKFDFWNIYESIKQFYPIGFRKDDPWKMFYSYPGLYRLGKIKSENILDENNLVAGKNLQQKLKLSAESRLLAPLGDKIPVIVHT